MIIVYCIPLPLLKYKLRQAKYLCSLTSPRFLEQCLRYGRHIVNICWKTELLRNFHFLIPWVLISGLVFCGFFFFGLFFLCDSIWIQTLRMSVTWHFRISAIQLNCYDTSALFRNTGLNLKALPDLNNK